MSHTAGEPGPYGPASGSPSPSGGPPAPPPPPGYGPGPSAGYGVTPAYGGYGGPVDTSGGSPFGELATWAPRVGAFVLDRLISIGPLIVLSGVGAILLGASSTTDPLTGHSQPHGPLSAIGFVLVGLGYLSVLVVEIWNRWIRAGRTGQSFGKKVLGLHLIGAATGQPIGALMAFVRDLCHFVDGAICYVGYLFPLWDAKRQTLADKIVGSLVVRG